MGIFLMTQSGAEKIPTVGGVANIELLSRVAILENEIVNLKRKATESEYGLSKISDASDVTETSNGLVLSAKEKNASIEGSLAHDILMSQEKSKAVAFTPEKLLAEGSYVDVYCYALNNFVTIQTKIDVSVSFPNVTNILRVPTEFAPKTMVNWTLAGIAHVAPTMTGENAIPIFARVHENGNIMLANDFGCGVKGASVNFSYVI